MSPLSTAYEPKEVEPRWYEAWLAGECFTGRLPAAGEAAVPYSITIPPPNVTGVLHMGHILNNTFQDILARRARQEGKRVVWVPGTDHAGIATQTRVEKLLREQGTSRRALGREAFIERVCHWRDEHGGIILDQLKKLGCSCDWSRNVHTLDDASKPVNYSGAVLSAFVELFHKGHIYRGKRMVNWCPKSLTALSDEEVTLKPQKGFLYRMRYEVAEHPGTFIEIATTRPETLMGDTAVAIHPLDERYTHLHGCHAVRPFPRALIPFVCDTHVDREFGTGVLKVTPAHDRSDFEIGLRHRLPVLDVMTPDGHINCPEVPELHGLERFAARKKAAEMLESLGLLVARQPYENNVGYSERADVPVEPRLSDQWWLRYPKVKEAREAVCPSDGSEPLIRFTPERWTKTYAHWLEGIQDWCISRQLWWGHRIPVWYHKSVDRGTLTEEDLHNPEKVHVSLEGPADPANWHQEEDVLDTWASSWLWPFGVFGWPESPKTEKSLTPLSFWYPTDVLCTGPDIIFFWVARMIMAGLEFTGKVPFRHVVFNGIIRDEQGRKMSKSLGNSPDPLDLIEKFGADGLRLGMLMMAPKGSDILFSEDRVQLGRNFCNKLWNACRFRRMQQTDEVSSSLDALVGRLQPQHFDADDHAILGRLISTLEVTEAAYRNFEFNTLTDALYKFFWTDYCDWYVEVSKAKLSDSNLRVNCLSILDLCLRSMIQMMAPITPFITEELWNTMGYNGSSASRFIQDTPLLTASELSHRLSAQQATPSPKALESVASLQDFVLKARALKAQYRLAAKSNVTFHLSADALQLSMVQSNSDKLKKLIGFETMTPASEPSSMPRELTALGTLYLDLSGSVDVEAEKKKLSKQIEALDKAIASGEARLSNEKFVSSAPADIIQGAKEQLAMNQSKRAELRKLMASL